MFFFLKKFVAYLLKISSQIFFKSWLNQWALHFWCSRRLWKCHFLPHLEEFLNKNPNHKKPTSGSATACLPESSIDFGSRCTEHKSCMEINEDPCSTAFKASVSLQVMPQLFYQLEWNKMGVLPFGRKLKTKKLFPPPLKQADTIVHRKHLSALQGRIKKTSRC